jgi:hypothetical protein
MQQNGTTAPLSSSKSETHCFESIEIEWRYVDEDEDGDGDVSTSIDALNPLKCKLNV